MWAQPERGKHAVSILNDPDRPASGAAGAAAAGARTEHPPRQLRFQERRWPLLAGAAALALVAGTAGGLAGAQLSEPTEGVNDTVTVIGSDPARVAGQSAESTAGVASEVLPSVVSISASDGTGSGFVISEDGYILTNYHVVAAGTDVENPSEGGTVELELHDGRQYDAEVVGTSPSYDLAVLSIDADDLEPVTLGDSSTVAVGDPVIAIGSPLGLESTVTSGIISARERPVTAGESAERSYINALQTDAAINPGNSGGPLVDADGRVVGVNSAIATLSLTPEVGSIGLGFAIPIDQARRTAEQLISDGEAVYPIMGVLLDNRHGGPGARVAEGDDEQPGVTPDGPADAAGVQPGDLIIAFEGERIPSPGALIVMLRSQQPGDTVTLTLERDDRSFDVEVTLDEAVG
ncbi:S1C family serine protease [Phytoactinopolyspora halophila]|uniref:S1C family serine protease n=1 Tax=Phytoactinopolyspora halophila TaxID=1981511 RepID=UPI001314538D|nr:trypsin-like peptidase domain-containing protein [Phytoactinopolyspora halophila]